MIILCLLLSQASRGQELPGIGHRPVKPADTASILSLVRQGNDLVNNRPDSALALYNTAIQLSRNGGYEDGFGYALANKGLALTSMGQFDKGMDCYQSALPYCLKARSLPYALIYLYFNMAMSWATQENYLKANEYYHKVLDLVQERYPGNTQFLIGVYNNMVAIQVNMGSYNQAIRYSNMAILHARLHNKKPELAQILMNKGDIYWTLKQYDSAMQYYDTAYRYVKEVNDPVLNQSYDIRMGDVLLELNRYEEALDYLQKARALNTDYNPLRSITGGYSLGDALYRLGRNREAEQVLLEALALADRTGLTKNKQNGHGVLMALYKKEGRYEEAFEQLSQYQSLSDSIINQDKIRAVNEIEVKYQVAQKDKAIVQRELMIAQQQKKLYRNKILILSIIGGTLLLGVGATMLYRHRRKIGLRDREIERLKAMMDGEEQERVRLSRELHDGLGGMLTGIKLSLRSIERQQDATPQKGQLTGIMNMLQDMGEEIRQAAHNLMPDMLLKHRLKEALELYCEHLSSEGQLTFDLQCYGNLELLDTTMELQVYRIVQELLQNVIKHAAASHAIIQLRYDEGTIRLSVEDDGKGFDTEQPNRGAGLSNIAGRIKALHGYFSIASTPAMGTTVHVEFIPDTKFLKA